MARGVRGSTWTWACAAGGDGGDEPALAVAREVPGRWVAERGPAPVRGSGVHRTRKSPFGTWVPVVFKLWFEKRNTSRRVYHLSRFGGPGGCSLAGTRAQAAALSALKPWPLQPQGAPPS